MPQVRYNNLATVLGSYQLNSHISHANSLVMLVLESRSNVTDSPRSLVTLGQKSQGGSSSTLLLRQHTARTTRKRRGGTRDDSTLALLLCKLGCDFFVCVRLFQIISLPLQQQWSPLPCLLPTCRASTLLVATTEAMSRLPKPWKSLPST